MSSKITVITRPKNRISINTTQRTQVKSVNVVGATTTGSSGPVTTQLSQLQDVDASDVDNNETLVYDETSEKFVVKELPIINGGTF